MTQVRNCTCCTLPNCYIVVGTLSLIVAVALACLGGMNILSSSILDKTRLALVGTAGGLTVISLGLFILKCRSYRSEKALNSYLHHPNSSFQKEIITPTLEVEFNKLTNEQRQDILRKTPSTVVSMWNLMVKMDKDFQEIKKLSSDFWKSFFKLLFFEGSEKVLKRLLEHFKSDSTFPSQEFVYNFRFYYHSAGLSEIISPGYFVIEESIRVKVYQILFECWGRESSSEYDYAISQFLEDGHIKVESKIPILNQDREKGFLKAILQLKKENRGYFSSDWSSPDLIIDSPTLVHIVLNDSGRKKELINALKDLFPGILELKSSVSWWDKNSGNMATQEMTPLEFCHILKNCQNLVKVENDDPILEVLQN